MKQLSLFLFATILLFACDTETSESADATTDPVQAAWDSMMVIHDEIMPEMSTLKRLQREIKALPQDSTTQQTFTQLERSGQAMWDWMSQLKQKKEVLAMPEEEALNYVKETTLEIRKVEQSMLESIERGKALAEKE